MHSRGIHLGHKSRMRNHTLAKHSQFSNQAKRNRDLKRQHSRFLFLENLEDRRVMATSNLVDNNGLVSNGNTLGVITPSSNPGAAAAVLRTTAAGAVTIERLLLADGAAATPAETVTTNSPWAALALRW